MHVLSSSPKVWGNDEKGDEGLKWIRSFLVVRYKDPAPRGSLGGRDGSVGLPTMKIQWQPLSQMTVFSAKPRQLLQAWEGDNRHGAWRASQGRRCWNVLKLNALEASQDSLYRSLHKTLNKLCMTCYKMDSVLVGHGLSIGSYRNV